MEAFLQTAQETRALGLKLIFGEAAIFAIEILLTKNQKFLGSFDLALFWPKLVSGPTIGKIPRSNFALMTDQMRPKQLIWSRNTAVPINALIFLKQQTFSKTYCVSIVKTVKTVFNVGPSNCINSLICRFLHGTKSKTSLTASQKTKLSPVHSIFFVLFKKSYFHSKKVFETSVEILVNIHFENKVFQTLTQLVPFE